MTIESRNIILLSMRQDGTPGWSCDSGIRLRDIGEAVGSPSAPRTESSSSSLPPSTSRAGATAAATTIAYPME
jgi:hypothetical protein